MAKSTKIPTNIASLSFEAALKELETIVSQLEQGKVELEKSIEIYERGTQLKAHCEAKLKDAQARVDRIVVASDGSVKAEPADLD